MALLGGVHRLWGPLVGVIPFTLLWEFISAKFPAQTTLLLGACFLLIVYFIPRGVVGLIEDLRAARRPVAARPANGSMLQWRKRPCLAPRQQPALRVSGVSKRFGGLVAVDDMSFELARERGAGPDRAERLRQDHDAEPDFRRAEAERRRRSGSYGDDISAAPANEIADKRRRPHVPDRAHAAGADGAGERRRRRRVRPQPALGRRARRLRRDLLRRVGLEAGADTPGGGADLYRPEAGRARPRAGVRPEGPAARRVACRSQSDRAAHRHRADRAACAPKAAPSSSSSM